MAQHEAWQVGGSAAERYQRHLELPGADAGDDGMIHVQRTRLFDRAMASFEGA
jgi:hypothetical protein